MTNEIDITVSGMWEAGIKGPAFNDLPEDMKLQFKITFYAGVHSMLHVNQEAHINCTTQQQYQELLNDLHAECVAMDDWITDLMEKQNAPEKPKKPHLKLVKEITCKSPE